MRVTVYFLVRLISLYGLSAAAVQNRPYSNVLDENQVYERFDPKELEAAFSITPIEHPLAEPSYVKHLAGFNVHGTDKSQEVPEILSSTSKDSQEKDSQLTWSTNEAEKTVNYVQNSQQNYPLKNDAVTSKTSIEDLSIPFQQSSTENVPKSRKSRENHSQENLGLQQIPDSNEEEQRKSFEESNLYNNRGYQPLKKENYQNQLIQYESNETFKNKLRDDSKELVDELRDTSYLTKKKINNLSSANSQEASRNTYVKNLVQDNSNKEQVLVTEGVSNPVQYQHRGYQNSANSNEQKSITHEENLVSVRKQINSNERKETSNDNPNIEKHQFQYTTSGEKTSQNTWKQNKNQETIEQKFNTDQSAQFFANSREKQIHYDSNEQGSNSYENPRELNKNNQKNNKYVWSSSNHRDHRNKQQDHSHVKRSQNLLNSQEEQLNLRYRSNVSGQKQQHQKYDSSEEIQKSRSNMNSLQYKQYIENLRQRQNKQQAKENTAYEREHSGYFSYEEKSQELGSSEEQRDQSSERNQPSMMVSKKLFQYVANSDEDWIPQIYSKTGKQPRTPKYVTDYRKKSNKQDYRKAKNSKEYPKNNNVDISKESSEDSILQKSFDHYYPKENVMVPFVYSMHSPMPINVRKIFMMSKSYMNNPLDYQTPSSDYNHGFHTSEDMVRFHETLEESMKDNKQSKMNSTELITLNNYAVEEHNVTTEDGYILQMIRMSSHQSSQNVTKKPVVFLMHGFLGSSDDWLLMGPKKALAYLLADAGYDVWLGNARGNKYSRQHISKKPEQPEFWKFSNDEIALSDLPAMIDYALNTTQQKQMFYVGFSQGNAQFFALASTRPEYNEKIKIMYALSPMSFMKNTHSMLVKMFAPENPLSELIEKHMQTHSKTGEFKFQDKFLSLAGKDICMATIGCNTVCSNINFVMSGFNVEQLEPEMAAMILGHTPVGGSVLQMIQLGQATEDFRMFDYGLQINQQVYGTSEPPSYNVKLVTAPVAMYSSKDDWLAATEDVEKLEAELPNIIKNYKIKNNYFTSLDFIYGKMATEMYQNIIKSMRGFEKNRL